MPGKFAAMTTVSDTVGANIRSLRQQNGWTVADLAARCAALGGGAEALTPAAITNIELGRRDKEGNRRRDITVDELLALSYAFAAPPSALMTELGDDLADTHLIFGVGDMIERLKALKEWTERLQATAAKNIFGPPRRVSPPVKSNQSFEVDDIG